MALGNSSTNFNRKRSAYVLKRFFCDDLIPVGFETPQEHVGGSHGSQTSCYACHHKLDPMAGFFRSYGAYFFDYSRSPDITFDDLASKDRAPYEGIWKGAGTGQPAWNIGYHPLGPMAALQQLRQPRSPTCRASCVPRPR